MNSLSKERILTWVIPLALVAVLTVLAVLQYRWSHQVSEAATTRMQADLQSSMMNFRQDLAREVATICLELQGDEASTVDAKGLTQKLEHWQRTSSLSGLVADVYVWKSSGVASPLLRLIVSQSRFEPMVVWPLPLSKLRELLATDLAGGRPDRGRSDGRRHPELSGPIIGGIDERIPVLIVPATRTPESTWLLVELDPTVLREQIFPQLAKRYFGDSRTSDYEVAVVADSSDHPPILYASDAGFGKNGPISSDGALNLFGPPVSKGMAPRPPLGFARSVREPPPRVEGTRASVGMPEMGFDKIRFDPVGYGSDEPNWQIVVKHRKGSVAAAVAELRYRNLEISFGVLLLLAASMGLIIFNSQRARRLAKLQMDFVAGVSHELRTPVAAILAISENIVDGVVEDQQQLLRYGGMIRNQAKRLHHLVEQVLRFAATQRRATSFMIRPLRVSDVIDEVLDNMASLLSASGCVVETKIEPDLPLVEADFGVLSQCLQNLITNAVKYGGDGKWIGLRAGSTAQGSAREVSIMVEDHGIGIEQQELKHVFEPFYRSPTVAESQVPGTGLGLALAKSFAEAMGGRLTVVSQTGKGTAFTLHFPAMSEAGTASRGSS
jgi:signal transduction histidine kinase